MSRVAFAWAPERTQRGPYTVAGWEYGRAGERQDQTFFSSTFRGRTPLRERPLGLVFQPERRRRGLLQVAALSAVPFKFHLEWNKLRCQETSTLPTANRTQV